MESLEPYHEGTVVGAEHGVELLYHRLALLVAGGVRHEAQRCRQVAALLIRYA